MSHLHDEHIRLDHAGNPHVVRVFKCAGGTTRFVVDGRHEVEAEREGQDTVEVPALGKLTRPWVR